LPAKTTKTLPLNNNVLIEVQRDYDGVSRTDETETMKYGRLLAYHIEPYHLTASAAIMFDQAYLAAKQNEFRDAIGKIVRWEEYAEGGQTFVEDGKTYALIPWWRLIGYEE
jgi:hypothetical protein